MSSLWTGPREEPRRYRVDLVDGVLVDVGHGGEGLVYRAYRNFGCEERQVALKIHSALTLDDFDRFAERARALSEIDHPNVMHLVDAFVGTALVDRQDPEDDDFDVMYTAAEWIPGLSLQAAVKATDHSFGLRWIAQVARATGYLHHFRSIEAPAGIIHRDIKPSNVRITVDFQAVLIDFGIARPHQDGDLTEGAGTYLWRAPEVLGGPGKPGPASDVWGIGALAYWVFTGEPPRLEGSAAARERLFHAARGGGFADPVSLAGHIAALLETDPADRPMDLAGWADLTMAELDKVAKVRRFERLSLRARMTMAAGCLVALGSGTGAAFALSSSSKAQPPIGSSQIPKLGLGATTTTAPEAPSTTEATISAATTTTTPPRFAAANGAPTTTTTAPEPPIQVISQFTHLSPGDTVAVLENASIEYLPTIEAWTEPTTVANGAQPLVWNLGFRIEAAINVGDGWVAFYYTNVLAAEGLMGGTVNGTPPSATTGNPQANIAFIDLNDPDTIARTWIGVANGTLSIPQAEEQGALNPTTVTVSELGGGLPGFNSQPSGLIGNTTQFVPPTG